MRVLHVLDHSIPLQSGYTFRTRAILEGQRALGWETFQLTSAKQGPGDASVEHVDGLTFHRTRPGSGPLARLPVLRQLDTISTLERRLEQVAGEVEPDLLHAHSPALNGEAAARVARRLGLPLVYEVRAFWEDAAVDHGTSREGGARYRLTRALETRVLRAADAVTTICEGLRRDIVARGIDAGKVTVIPNAVDPARFATDPPRDAALARALGLEGKTVLGFIGSFYAYEGLAVLLAALGRIVEAAPEVRLLLVGGGPQEAMLRRAAAGLGQHVVFTSRVPHDDVPRYYGLVDVFVYPRISIRLTELVTPLKPLEAMAQRRLVVASDVGGHRELIADGQTGYLFPAGDPDAVASTVLRVLAERDRWDRVRAAARDFVERERCWQASVSRYVPVYERVGARTACADV